MFPFKFTRWQLLKQKVKLEKELGPRRAREQSEYAWKAFSHDCKIKPYKWGDGSNYCGRMRKGLWL